MAHVRDNRRRNRQTNRTGGVHSPAGLLRRIEMPELLVKKEAIRLLQDMSDMDFRETLKFAPTYRTERYKYYSADDLTSYATNGDGGEINGEKFYLIPIQVLKEYYRDKEAELLERILDAKVPTYHRAGKKFVRVRYTEIVPCTMKTS